MRLKLTAILALPFLLSACATDVLSTKPETDARIPKTAPETPVIDAPTPPEPIEEIAPPPEPEPEAPVAEPEPVETPAPTPVAEDTAEERIPYTTKLVRGIINGGTIALATNDTLTLAISANRDIGYQWELGPLPEGLVSIGDYYRTDGPFPNRPTIGGSRYFLLRANTAGNYPIKMKHVRGDDVRATKSFSVDVSDAS